MRRSPDSDEEESFSAGPQGSLRRTRRSLRSGEGSISEAQGLNQQGKEGRVRRGQTQATAEEGKGSVVEIHVSSEEKKEAAAAAAAAAAAVEDAAKEVDPAYFETSL